MVTVSSAKLTFGPHKWDKLCYMYSKIDKINYGIPLSSVSIWQNSDPSPTPLHNDDAEWRHNGRRTAVLGRKKGMTSNKKRHHLLAIEAALTIFANMFFGVALLLDRKFFVTMFKNYFGFIRKGPYWSQTSDQARFLYFWLIECETVSVARSAVTWFDSENWSDHQLSNGAAPN